MTSRICYDWRQIRAFRWKTSQKSPKIDKGDWWLFFCVQTGYPQSTGVSNLFDHSYLHVTGDGKPTRRRRNKQDGTVVERRNVLDRSKTEIRRSSDAFCGGGVMVFLRRGGLCILRHNHSEPKYVPFHAGMLKLKAMFKFVQSSLCL